MNKLRLLSTVIYTVPCNTAHGNHSAGSTYRGRLTRSDILRFSHTPVYVRRPSSLLPPSSPSPTNMTLISFDPANLVTILLTIAINQPRTRTARSRGLWWNIIPWVLVFALLVLVFVFRIVEAVVSASPSFIASLNPPRIPARLPHAFQAPREPLRPESRAC